MTSRRRAAAFLLAALACAGCIPFVPII